MLNNYNVFTRSYKLMVFNYLHLFVTVLTG
jgi:hypothetical protein